MSKKFIKLFILFFVIFSSLFILLSAKENIHGAECDSATLNLTLREPGGKFIPDMNFAVFTQNNDVDGNPKPVKQVAAGKINSLLGMGTVKFTPLDGIYAIKLWSNGASANAGEFYFFNESFSCAQERNIEYTGISGAHVVMRSSQGELYKNYKFSLYTQRYDVDGMPIKEKQDLIGNFTTSEEGEVTVYLADQSHFIAGKNGGTYTLEASGPEGGVFSKFGVFINDGQITEVNYQFSDIEFLVKDINGNNSPNTKIEVFKQKKDVNGASILGDKITTLTTNNKGSAVFVYPPDVYAVRIKDLNGQYVNFFNYEMIEQTRKKITLKMAEDYNIGTETCDVESKFTLKALDIAGNYVSNLNFEIYEQAEDADGNPVAGKSIKSGKVGEAGEGFVIFKPDSRKIYALKIYQSNKNVGDFWVYNYIKFKCGENFDYVKKIPAFKIVIRDADGNLLKNQKFSLYTQKFDVDLNPTKEKKDLVGSYTVPETGEITLYLAPDHPFDINKRGVYVFSVLNNKVEYLEYGVNVINDRDLIFEYVLSDIVFEVKNSISSVKPSYAIEIYKQEKDINGNNILSKDKVGSIKTGVDGRGNFQYVAGVYALKLKDDLGKEFIIWDVEIKNQKRTEKEIILNVVRFKGEIGENIEIYNAVVDNEENYLRDKKLKDIKIEQKGYSDIMLAPGIYIFSVKAGKGKEIKEYSILKNIESEKLQEISIAKSSENIYVAGKKFKTSNSSSMAQKLKGYILLQVEGNGEAWYVYGKSGQRYYMKNGTAAYDMMRKFGLGITNENLMKIPIGINKKFSQTDSDNDGLPDKMEEALGTDINNPDSDNDGYNDGDEVEHGYDPLGKGKINIDNALAKKLSGEILIQVESKGEAWYVNPKDGKRYYMTDGDSAYQIMRFLSLGITNVNLSQIKEGKLE